MITEDAAFGRALGSFESIRRLRLFVGSVRNILIDILFEIGNYHFVRSLRLPFSQLASRNDLFVEKMIFVVNGKIPLRILSYR